MKNEFFQKKAGLFGNTPFQLVLFVFVLLLISNLNAIVDSFLHPEIPYFDDEHLIVGGITGLVNAVLFGLILLYARHLERALGKIRQLESFLPICCNCKKVRTADPHAAQKESWQPIDSYITEHTSTQFSHSLCPECMKTLYPDIPQEELDTN